MSSSSSCSSFISPSSQPGARDSTSVSAPSAAGRMQTRPPSVPSPSTCRSSNTSSRFACSSLRSRHHPLLLVPTGGRVDASRACGGRAAPDALVAAVPVPMSPVRPVDAAASVAGRTAPLAVFLVIDVLMKSIRAIGTSVSIARRSAMSAFRAHAVLLIPCHLLYDIDIITQEQSPR